MTRRFGLGLIVLVAAALLPAAPVAGQSDNVTLGTARIPRAVMASGQALAAGTYTLRVSQEAIPAVVGQTPGESRWIEFVQAGQVKGREVATVLTGPEATTVAKGGQPGAGRVRVDMLKGGDYLRVWANRAGTHYLVHLPLGK